MRVTIRGVTYETVAEAAGALGVTRNAIYNALERGSIDKVGLGAGGITRNTPFAGWPSMTEASRALGMHPNYVREVLLRGGRRAREGLIRRVMVYQHQNARRAYRPDLSRAPERDER